MAVPAPPAPPAPLAPAAPPVEAPVALAAHRSPLPTPRSSRSAHSTDNRSHLTPRLTGSSPSLPKRSKTRSTSRPCRLSQQIVSPNSGLSMVKPCSSSSSECPLGSSTYLESRRVCLVE